MTLTLEQVRQTRFHLARRNGYEPDDVDAFVDKVELTLSQLTEENSTLQQLLRDCERMQLEASQKLRIEPPPGDSALVHLLLDYLYQPHLDEPAPKRAAAPLAGTIRWGPASVQLFCDALDQPSMGSIYLGGEAGTDLGERVAAAIDAAAGLSGLIYVATETAPGSFWQRFQIAWRELVGKEDLATIKRAGEVHLLDKHESVAAESYANAIAALAAAAGDAQTAVFHAKNVVFVQVPGPDGRPVRASRVLTNAEVLEFESGSLSFLATDPQAALAFVSSGQLPRAFDQRAMS